jgi:type III secretory pathway component EscU
LPPELAQGVAFWIQALGGLFVIYIIFVIIRLFFQWRYNRYIKQMRNDITSIKKELKIRNKKIRKK